MLVRKVLLNVQTDTQISSSYIPNAHTQDLRHKLIHEHMNRTTPVTFPCFSSVALDHLKSEGFLYETNLS